MTDPTGPANDHTNRPAPPSPEPAAKKRTAIWIVVVLFVAGAALGAYSMNAQFNEADKAESGFSNFDAGVSAPSGAPDFPKEYRDIDLKKASLDDYNSEYVSMAQRIDYVVPIIKQKRTQAISDINRQFAALDQVPLDTYGPVVEANISNTGQEILNQESLGLWISSSDTDKLEGQNLSASFIAPTHPNSSITQRAVAKQEIVVGSQASGESSTFTEGVLRDPAGQVFYEADGVPTKVVKKVNSYGDGAISVDIYQLISGNDDDNKAWVNVHSLTDLEYAAYPDPSVIQY